MVNRSPEPTPRRLRRFWLAHYRLALMAVTACAVYAMQDHSVPLATRLLVAWNCGVFIYLLAVVLMLSRGSTMVSIRQRAALYDENDTVFLFLMIAVTAGSFGMIILEIASPQGLKGWTLGMAVSCILLSWIFTHVLFALHYAHLYYSRDEKGLERGGFLLPCTPGSEARPVAPGYLDFFYFSFVIGCATATADISITARAMRSLALVHGVIAFIFNTTILALTINIAAGRLSG